MQTLNTFPLKSVKTMVLTSLLAFSSGVFSASLPSIIDDFSNAKQTNSGLPRQYISDTVAGGKTHAEPTVAAGVMHVKGQIVPPRGQPGWASTILPLSAMGSAQDASRFSGIRLRVKINSGNMTLSANSTEITNFDYHAAPIAVPSDGHFHEVKIPFSSMKRAWSQQTPLNPATLNSLSIVAYAMQKAPFDFEVDDVSFY